MSNPIFDSPEEERVYNAIKETEAHWERFRSRRCLRCSNRDWGPITTEKIIDNTCMKATCRDCGFTQRMPVIRRLTVMGDYQ